MTFERPLSSKQRRLTACRFAIVAFLAIVGVICAFQPAALAQSGTIHFAAVGDFGLAGQPESDVANLIKSWNPDFVITLGDNNYPGGAASTIDANIGQYFHSFIYPYRGKYGAGATTNRFFPSIGNHDWGNLYPNPNGLKPYLDYFTLPNNERYYDFTAGPVQFFVLDSDQNEPDGTSSTSTQGRWLQAKLAASTATWKIVYFHHTPYTSTNSFVGPTARMQWPFQQWGATAVLAGHVHNYERIMLNNFPYFVNGSGGSDDLVGPTGTTQGSVVQYWADFGAMRITASSSAITFDFITRGGLLIDEYTISFGIPSNLSAVAGTGQVGLSWTGATGAKSYNVKRGTKSGGPYTTIAPSVTGTAYTDTGVTNGTTYYYVVTANTAAGESANSNEASATPQVSALRINAGGAAYSGSIGTFVADNYFSSGYLWSYSTRNIANTSDPSLYLDVRASDTSISYSLPAVTGPYTLKLHFAECTYTGAGQRLMNISVNGSQVLSNFDIFAAAGGMNTAVVKSLPVTAVNNKIDLTLTSTLTSSGAVIAAIEVVPSAPAGMPPAPPTGLTATAAPAAAVLNWSPSSGATSYNVKRGTASGGPYTTLPGSVTTTTFTDSGLSAGTTYYYVVTASNSAGQSGNSSEVSVAPLAQQLAPPTNLSAVGGNKQAVLTWTGSSGATGYSVLRSTTNGGPYTSVGPTVTTTTYTDTGLTNGTTYYYVVQAVNASSQSGNSNQASAVPAGMSLRINAGGSNYNGTTGLFQADTDFSGGFLWSYSTRNIVGTADPALYLDVRASDTSFAYNLPVPAGSYTVKLHFAECTYSGAGQRLMNISINGTQVLTNFDVFASAGAMNTAVIKSFQATAVNGQINVSVASALTSSGAAMAAIEVISN